MATKTTTTKTAAAKTKVVKAGGAKGQRILDVIKGDKKKELTRRQIAEAAEATVGRVGEVVRWLAANGSATEQKAVAHLVTPAKTAAPKAKPEPAKKTPAKRTAKPAPKAKDIKTEEDAVKAVHDIVEG